jgi:hypothetical protein
VLELHPDGLAAARARATKGQCIFCEEPVPPSRGRPRFICGTEECRKTYVRAYARDRRHGDGHRVNVPPGWRVRWYCGCGKNLGHGFFRARHRWLCLFSRAAWPLVVVPRGAAPAPAAMAAA